MDHAEWVEGNNRAANRNNAKRRGFKPLPEKLGPFQRKVADILGMVGNGIYNAPVAHDKIDWDYGFNGVSVTWGRSMSTFDFSELTLLVLLCHEARIRCCIGPAGPRLLRLSFWPRVAKGGMSSRHPNIDEAVASFRAYLPEGHRVTYVEPGAVSPEAGEARVVESESVSVPVSPAR